MTARSEARAADHDYRSVPARFRIGQRVRSQGHTGTVEFVAHTNAMESPLYTVRFDSRITLRLLERDLQESHV